jgi:ATP-dependent protease HslVU (ClpYQ) peptidase subunit
LPVKAITKDLVITVKDPVAMIGSTKYASFADAVNAVADGQTIVVLAGTYADNVTFTKDNVTVLTKQRCQP